MSYDKLKALLQERNIKKVYIPDTNVLITNPFAMSILSGNEIPKHPDTSRMAELVRSMHIEWSRDPNAVCLVSTVEHELDNVKANDRKPHFVKLCANTALRNLEHILSDAYSSGSTTDLGDTLCADYAAQPSDVQPVTTFSTMPFVDVQAGVRFGNAVYFEAQYSKDYAQGKVLCLDEINADSRIALSASYVQQQLGDQFQVIFVSDDAGARAKAFRFGVRAEPFRYESVKSVEDLYHGRKELEIPDDDYRTFLKKRRIRIQDVQELVEVDPKPNQVIELRSSSQRKSYYGFVSSDAQYLNWPQQLQGGSQGPTTDALAKAAHQGHTNTDERNKRHRRRKGNRGSRSNSGQKESMGPIKMRFNPKLQLTRDQNQLLELLRTPRITCVSVVGAAGTGKTLCSLLAGFQQVQENRYSNVMYSRPLVTMGGDIGYLPGSMKRKMAPWVEPAEENLRRIFGAHNASQSTKQQIAKQIEDLYRDGLFEVAPPSFIPGRTISDSYIIVDEAHNMTREQLKMWLSRVGVGSKIVFLGDPGQIMNGKGTFVTKANNGLVHAIDKLPGQHLYAHLTLREVKRSETAELAKLL